MSVLENVTATTENMGSLDPSSGPSPSNSGIAVPLKSKVDWATRNKPRGSKVEGSRTFPKKKLHYSENSIFMEESKFESS